MGEVRIPSLPDETSLSVFDPEVQEVASTITFYIVSREVKD